MPKELLLFIIAFIIALVWYRIKFKIAPASFEKPWLRSLLKLRWHPLHDGTLLMLIAVIVLIFWGTNDFVFILFGAGLGLTVDLFIPALFLETDREKELVAYKTSLMPTLLLGSFIIFIIAIIYNINES